MERSVNKVELSGFVGMDPMVINLKNGGKIARVKIATNESYKNAKGDWIKTTTWHSLVFWNKNALKAEGEIKKGSGLSLTGKLATRSYTDKEGILKFVTEVIVNSFDLFAKD